MTADSLHFRFNLCKESVEETKKVCKSIMEEVFVPALKKPAEGFDEMSRALVEGMWAMTPFLNYEAFLAFTLRLAGVKNSREDMKSRYSRALLSYQIFVHEVLLGTWLVAWLVRPVHNFLTWFSVFMTIRLPVLAYLKFGRNQIY